MSLRAPVLACLLSTASFPALAQTCSFSVSDVSFGSVDSLSGAAADSSGTVTASCFSGILTNVRVCLNINAGSGGSTSGTRHMLNTALDQLDYNLYSDAARTTPWGSREMPSLGSPVSIDFTQLLGTVEQTRTIYGRVLANQQAAPTGTYASTFSGAEVSFNYATYLIIGSPPNCSTVTGNTTRPSFTAQATVSPNCLVSAQDIDFGSQGVLDTAVDASGNVAATCTAGTAYTISLDNGLTGTGPTARRMTLAGSHVTYGLYKDAARSQPWGSSGGELVTGTGTGLTENVSVYGRVPAQSTPAPGTYTDTIVVTVTY